MVVTARIRTNPAYFMETSPYSEWVARTQANAHADAALLDGVSVRGTKTLSDRRYEVELSR
jgi:hypothetical protein